MSAAEPAEAQDCPECCLCPQHGRLAGQDQGNPGGNC